jgi:Tol biopolymer transport system component
VGLAVVGCAPPAAPPAPAPGAIAGARLTGDVAVTPAGTRYAGATFSPDGRRLALAAAGLDAIDVVDADGGGGVRRVVAAERSGYRFAWAPDGDSLVHRVGTSALVRTWLGGRAEVVAEGQRVGFPAVGPRGEVHFSADGELREARAGAGSAEAGAGAHAGLVTVRAAAAPLVAGWDGARIFVVDLENGGRRDLFVGPGFFDVELARDGRLALVRESRGADGYLWIAATDGGLRRDLGVGWLGRLAPDGRSVVYVLQINDGARFTAADLWLAGVDGRERVRLTATPDVLEIEPAFAPDGGGIAYVDAATGRVHVARLEGVRP